MGYKTEIKEAGKMLDEFAIKIEAMMENGICYGINRQALIVEYAYKIYRASLPSNSNQEGKK